MGRGLINFGLLDPNLPEHIMDAPARAQKEQMANQIAQATLARSQDQGALAKYSLAKAGREDKAQAGLLQALQGGMDPVQAYTRFGQPDKAIKMQSDQAGLEKGKIEKALKLTELWKHYGDSVYADPTEENAIMATMEAAKVAGADPTQAVAKIKAMGGDPALIRKWAASHALTAKEMAPKLANFNAGGTQAFVSQDPQSGELLGRTDVPRTMSPESIASNERIRQEGALNRGVQMRGQNMTDTRMRESYQSGGTGGKAPTGYKWAADGEMLEFVPGGPRDPAVQKALASDKPMTEFQGKSALYGTRAAQSDKVLKALEDTVSTTGLAVGQSLGTVGNFMMSQEQQRVTQAQRDFVNAVLRQESGAVISDAEFANAKKQYFPTPGDDPETISQKRANRQLAITGFARMSGPKGAEGINAIISEPLLPGVTATKPTPRQTGTATQKRRASDSAGMPDMSAIDAEIARRKSRR